MPDLAVTTEKIPVLIMTGFLGSGKTTILQNWLKTPSFEDSLVIVNEFGKAGLDQRVIRRAQENTVLLGGGCACCNLRADLIKELAGIINLRDQGTRVRRVIIETTGLADPAPILFSIMTDKVLCHHYQIMSTVCCVDAVNAGMQLDANPESVKQIAVADKVIITKTDLPEAEETDSLKARIWAINPNVAVFEAVFGDVDAAAVLEKMGPAKPVTSERFKALQSAGTVHENGLHTISITFDNRIDWSAFGLWLSALLFAHGNEIYRVKGILDTGAEGPVLLNGVQHIIHPPEHLESWGDEARRSELVFIMRQIDPLKILRSLQAFQNVLGARAEIREISKDPY